MPTGLYDTMGSIKKTDSPSLSVAEKRQADIRLGLRKDFNRYVKEVGDIVKAQPGGHLKNVPSARVKIIKLYNGVALAVARGQLSAGKEYRDNYYEKTVAGGKKMLEQVIAGKAPEFPELLRLFEFDEIARKDPDSKIMTVRDRNGDELDIDVSVEHLY